MNLESLNKKIQPTLILRRDKIVLVSRFSTTRSNCDNQCSFESILEIIRDEATNKRSSFDVGWMTGTLVCTENKG